jgi:hypothetical protein
MKWVATGMDSAQVVDDDVDEPGAERALLVLFLLVLHGILLNRSVWLVVTVTS